MKIWYITALMVAVAPASAEIYRCTDGNAVSFSDRPCVAEYLQKLTVSKGKVNVAAARSTASGDPGPQQAPPLSNTRRTQLEASIAVAMRRLDLLQREKTDAMSTFDSADSVDAQVLAHHYANIIGPLEQELDEMKSRLHGDRPL